MDQNMWTKSLSQLHTMAKNIQNVASKSEQAVNRAVHKVDWEIIGNNINKVTANTAASAAQAYHNGKVAPRDVEWDQIGPKAAEIIASNPSKVLIPAVIVAGAVTGPLLMGPVLGAAGFSSIGPVAGTIASGIQSAGLAGPVFSTVQSAAMGGYGFTAVAACFAGAGAAAGGAAAAASRESPGGESDEEENNESD
ncbi:hypothetical protein QQS21_008690 [Conoideocrella luteorostrata]|uniref:Uncharacterized protein n=1 Tax=Conoideocrella luteorostrata TaxID=1105319 RepID=A0AAJ0CL46_9HYPO|nr:hypothetical protein QQS21_008690 [Conoideocrella luteorostrata]